MQCCARLGVADCLSLEELLADFRHRRQVAPLLSLLVLYSTVQVGLVLSCQARLGAELLAGLGDKADLLGGSANLALQQLEQACTCPTHRSKPSTDQALSLHTTFGRASRRYSQSYGSVLLSIYCFVMNAISM